MKILVSNLPIHNILLQQKSMSEFKKQWLKISVRIPFTLEYIVSFISVSNYDIIMYYEKFYICGEGFTGKILNKMLK